MVQSQSAFPVFMQSVNVLGRKKLINTTTTIATPTPTPNNNNDTHRVFDSNGLSDH